MAPRSQPLGRPRDPGIDARLHAAVRDVLAEVGYTRLTVDAVAARARVGKAAIYRRYATRTELILAALFGDEAILHRADAVDTGTLAGDLAAEAAGLVALFGHPVAGAAVPGLLAELAADDAMATRAQEWFVAANLADIEAYLARERARRGVDRLGPGDDARLVHAALLGTVFAWLGMLRWEPPADLPSRVGALVAAGVTAPAADPPTARGSPEGGDAHGGDDGGGGACP